MSTLLGSIIQDNESSYATAVLWTRMTSAEAGCSVDYSALTPKVLAKRKEPLITSSHRQLREQVAEVKANGELGVYQFLLMMARMVLGVQKRVLQIVEMRNHHLPISARYPTTNWKNLWPMILFYQSVETISQPKAESEGLKVLGLAMILFRAKMKGFLILFHKIGETGQILKFIVTKSGRNALVVLREHQISCNAGE